MPGCIRACWHLKLAFDLAGKPSTEREGNVEFRELIYEEIDSTNNVVKQAIESGEAEGLVVRAWRQTGAYGRQGRAWASPEGGLYLSLLLRPEVSASQLPTLSLVAALAVCDALASLVTSDQAKRLRIKWPNDIIVSPVADATGEPADAAASPSTQSCRALEGSRTEVRFASEVPSISGIGETLADFTNDLRFSTCLSTETPAAVTQRPSTPRLNKLVGISTELHRGAICLGIGVNVKPPLSPDSANAAAFANTKNKPAYLSDLGFGFICDRRSGISEVAQAIQREFAQSYQRWLAHGFESFVPEYNRHAFLNNMPVSITNIAGEEAARGAVAGINEKGRLLLETEAGLKAISSGEAHVQLA